MTVPNPTGWCGRCGESFALREVVEPSGDLPAGACPRCGALLAPSYTVVMVAALRELLSAEQAVARAVAQLHDVAPALHLDRPAG